MVKTPDWVKHAVFYQIFPDRFARVPQPGDEFLHLESWDSPPTVYGFKGGNLQGVEERLDHLLELGITALYFNPIFASTANHRYHTYDYYQVDPLLGGNQAFRSLLDAAHQRGIRIVLDGVFNHASRGFWQFNHTLENKADSPYVDWFHFDPDRLSGKVPWDAYLDSDWEQGSIDGRHSLKRYGYQAWWDLPALPKFNTDFPAVREFIFDVAEHWIRFGIDGWRLDVPEEIDDVAFWQEFRKRIKSINPEAYIVGEIWQEARRWLEGDQFDAVMNYPITLASLGFFAGERIFSGKDKNVGDYHFKIDLLDGQQFSDRIDEIFNWYDPEIDQAQLNLLESHDTPRFVTFVGNDQDSLKMAALFMFTIPGAPTIYYGTEVGLDGKRDPDCRKAFPWDQREWDQQLLDFFKSCTRLRHEHPVLRTGSYRPVSADQDTFAFERSLGEQQVYVIFNVGEKPRRVFLPEVNGNVIFGEAALSKRDDGLEIEIGPRQGAVVRGI